MSVLNIINNINILYLEDNHVVQKKDTKDDKKQQETT